ncbi:hypothetical protein CEXT_233761 [Caerostris extrusa]|uniref:Uncharacterized protein n=1 Tax=Caerostris extrusa TaxID=172846 RepID=A0AAV4VW89_CAEEX|nr:hypothetical protein CEXT_233761 [Caerostris extrusa]
MFCIFTEAAGVFFQTHPPTQNKKKKSLTPACSLFFSAPHLVEPCDKSNPSIPPACLNINIPSEFGVVFKTETMGHRFSHLYKPTLSNPINSCKEVSAEEGSRKIFCLDFC